MAIVLIRDLNDFGEHKADCGGKLVQIWYVDPPQQVRPLQAVQRDHQAAAWPMA